MFHILGCPISSSYQLCSRHCSPTASSVALIVVGILVIGIGVGIGQAALLNRTISVALTASSSISGTLIAGFGLYKLFQQCLRSSPSNSSKETVLAHNNDVKGQVDSIGEFLRVGGSFGGQSSSIPCKKGFKKISVACFELSKSNYEETSTEIKRKIDEYSAQSQKLYFSEEGAFDSSGGAVYFNLFATVESNRDDDSLVRETQHQINNFFSS